MLNVNNTLSSTYYFTDKKSLEYYQINVELSNLRRTHKLVGLT